MAVSAALRAAGRLFRLWRVYAYLDFMVVTRSLRVFVTWYVSDMMLNLAAVSGMLLLAERFAGIGAWSKQQVIFMLGYASLTSGIVGVMGGYNVAFISRRLGRGQLDHTLLQPQPLWMALLTEGFSPAFGSATLLPGVGLMIWGGRRLALPMTPEWLAQLAVCLLSSAAILMAFQFLWGSLAFRAPRAAEEISSSTMAMLEQLKPYPLEGVGLWLAGSLLALIPSGFLGWLPARSLLGMGGAAGGWWMTPMAALAASALAFIAFQRGLRHYERVGSRRYSDFGHRR